MRPVKTDLRASFVSALHGLVQIAGPRRHSQHAAARGVIPPIPLRGSRVKHFYAIERPCLVEPVNSLPHFKRPRISSRSHHHARGRVLRPLEIAVAHTSL